MIIKQLQPQIPDLPFHIFVKPVDQETGTRRGHVIRIQDTDTRYYFVAGPERKQVTVFLPGKSGKDTAGITEMRDIISKMLWLDI